MNNDINTVIKSQGQPDGGEGHSAGQAIRGNAYGGEGLSANVRGDAQEPNEAILNRDESASQDFNPISAMLLQLWPADACAINPGVSVKSIRLPHRKTKNHSPECPMFAYAKPRGRFSHPYGGSSSGTALKAFRISGASREI